LTTLCAPAITSKAPRAMQSWSCFTTRDEVSFLAAHGPEHHGFARREFLVNGKLPAPAV
jgi:hypothetical protein